VVSIIVLVVVELVGRAVLIGRAVVGPVPSAVAGTVVWLWLTP
jgi:hypothetical protein